MQSYVRVLYDTNMATSKKQKIDTNTLYEKITEAVRSGKSYRVSDEERAAAKELIDAERCFWSGDYDHITTYQLRMLG